MYIHTFYTHVNREMIELTHDRPGRIIFLSVEGLIDRISGPKNLRILGALWALSGSVEVCSLHVDDEAIPRLRGRGMDMPSDRGPWALAMIC